MAEDTKQEATAENKSAEKPVKTEEKKMDAKMEEAEAKLAKEKESKGKSSAKKPAKGRKKPKRRIVTEGRAYIQASFNNTIISITDDKGDLLAWSSAGSNGFKGPKKATPYAAQTSAEKAVEKAKAYGVEKVHVFIKGAGNGREQAMRGLQTGGLNIDSITDVTAIPHNGCRQRKSRRV